jgi:hypothetical protein
MLRDHQVEHTQIIQSRPGFAEHIVTDSDYSVFRKAA